MNRIGVIGIAINNREQTSKKVNEILAAYARIIVGRMGVPYKEAGLSVISIIVNGSNDEIGALTGKLGNISGIKVKVALLH